MDLIDRQRAIKALDGEFHITGKDNAITVADYLNGITQALKCVPAIDAVEVVRCKDCKHRFDDGFCAGRGWPMGLVADDGYCDRGERKDG